MLCTDELICLLQRQLAARSQLTPPQQDDDWKPGMGDQSEISHPPTSIQTGSQLYIRGGQSKPSLVI